MPTLAKAREVWVPANPMTRDAVQVLRPFMSYERRTGVSDYAVGGGFHLQSLILGAAVRYHGVDRSENQLRSAHSPSDGVEVEMVVGNAGNLYSDLRLRDMCPTQGLKPEDCAYSNFSPEFQETYRQRGPAVDAPIITVLSLGGSYQDLTTQDPADASREYSQSMWGARARLGFGYLADADGLLGVSAGFATVGAAPAQVPFCTPLRASGTDLVCWPSYLDAYNRTSIVDVRLEWRQEVSVYGFNPALQAVFQRSRRDDPATPNDDASFGLRYVDFEIPVYAYLQAGRDLSVYAGARGIARWWTVERSRQAEVIGGVFVSMTYDGRSSQQPAHYRNYDPGFDGD